MFQRVECSVHSILNHLLTYNVPHLVEKKVPGEYRMIHYLSYPRNNSVNDGIPRKESFVQYISVRDAISHIKNCRVGAYCCKTDIKSAFMIINLNYSQFKYVCFCFVFWTSIIWKHVFNLVLVLHVGSLSVFRWHKSG